MTISAGKVLQKLIVMQIMQIVTCLQCVSLSGYSFYLQFKAFQKRSDISARKSLECAFSCTAAIFLHTTVDICFVLLNKSCCLGILIYDMEYDEMYEKNQLKV